jgi:hypothetical protein
MYDTYFCWPMHGAGWYCDYTGAPGAAGVTTVSDVAFKGSTVFKNNSWGALYVAAPVIVEFPGMLEVSSNRKGDLGAGRTNADSGTEDYGFAIEYGGGFEARKGARLLFNRPTVFR